MRVSQIWNKTDIFSAGPLGRAKLSSLIMALHRDCLTPSNSGMRKTVRSVRCLLFITFLVQAVSANTRPGASISPKLAFEPNRGQFKGDAQYISHGAEGSWFLDPEGAQAVLSNPQAPINLRMSFAGHRRHPVITPEQATGGVSNYYEGSDRRGWLEGIPQYGRVRYRELYRGIDLVFHGRGGRLEYDYEISPNANVSDIELEFAGDQSLALDSSGALLVRIGDKTVRFLAPEAFQFSGTEKIAVPVRFQLKDKHHIAFEIGQYDHRRLLTIDPVVEYTLFIGVNNSTGVTAIAVDGNGDLFMTGSTYATNYPNTGSPVNNAGVAAMYITKLDPSGTTVLYSTLLASGGGLAMTLDSTGNAYVAGVATGSAFTTTSQNLGSCSSSCNAGFATKFDTSGRLVYSTLLANGQTLPRAVAVAGSGELLLVGNTDINLPLVNAYQSTCASGCGPFLAKLNATGTAYDFATFFGTGGTATGVATDSSGNIYLAGAGSVPTVNAFENSGDAFISEFSPDGQSLLVSTYFGSVNLNYPGPAIAGLVAGTDGSLYLAGTAQSNDFPYALNAFRLPIDASGNYGMFAVGFSPGLASEKFSTYIGQGFANAIAIDSQNQIYIAGQFGPEPIPLKNPVVSDLNSGGFVMTLDNNGQLIASTEFGGRNEVEEPTALAVDSNFAIYLAGIPQSQIFSPVGNVLDGVSVGTGSSYSSQAALVAGQSFVGYATFVAKISTSNQPQVGLSYWQSYLVLRDAGSVDLSISNLTWNNTPITTGDCGTILSAGTSCVLNLPTPQSSGQLSITSNAQPATQVFAPGLSPFAGAWAMLDLRFSPLAFPPQQMNTTSQPQSFRIWNVQTTAQAISSITSQGTVVQTNDCPSLLAPQTYCTVTVVANPTPNSLTGLIIVNMPGGPSVMFWPYVGAAPSTPISVATSSVTFGSTAVGKSSLVRTLAIHNASPGTISTPTASISGQNFNIAGTTCTNSLASHDTCAVAIQYTPAGNENVSGTLNVSSGNANLSVQLNATGFIPSAVAVSPLQLAFYNVIIGHQSYPQYLTLTNTASTPVTVTGIHFGLSDYSETDTCQSAMDPGGTCSITVTGAPTVLGDRSSTMTITFDNAITQVVFIAMTPEYPIGINVFAPTFSPTPIHTTAVPVYLGLSNYDTRNLSYSISVSGDFSLQNYCANPLPVFTGCGNLQVYFSPDSPGIKQGTITLSVPGLPAYQMNLTASAVEVSTTLSRPSRPSTVASTGSSTPVATPVANGSSNLRQDTSESESTTPAVPPIVSASPTRNSPASAASEAAPVSRVPQRGLSPVSGLRVNSSVEQKQIAFTSATVAPQAPVSSQPVIENSSPSTIKFERPKVAKQPGKASPKSLPARGAMSYVEWELLFPKQAHEFIPFIEP
jgi:hypothetical protein